MTNAASPASRASSADPTRSRDAGSSVGRAPYEETTCRDGRFGLWDDTGLPNPDGDPQWWAQGPEQTTRVWIVDVAGTLASRNAQLETLFTDSSTLFAAITARRDAIHTLLVSTQTISNELVSLVDETGELTMAARSGLASGTRMTSMRKSAELGSSSGAAPEHPASSEGERTPADPDT